MTISTFIMRAVSPFPGVPVPRFVAHNPPTYVAHLTFSGKTTGGIIGGSMCAMGTPDDRAGVYGNGVVSLTLRIPDDLHARIRTIAEDGGVSLNVWLCLAATEKAAGTLRAEDVKRLDELEKRLEALEKRKR